MIASFRAGEVSPVEAVKKITSPILFIVGAQDEKIHPKYSQMLFEAATSVKEIFIIENANHANVREIAGKRYDEKLIHFYEAHLS